MVLVSHVTRFR